jgi:hypothetical protein
MRTMDMRLFFDSKTLLGLPSTLRLNHNNLPSYLGLHFNPNT